MQNNEKKSVFGHFVNILSGVLYTFFWILIIYGFDTPYIATLTIICAALHELGHIIAFRMLGRSKIPSSTANGLRLSDRDISYRERIFVCLCGPAVNAVLCVVTLLFFSHSAYAVIFAFLNLLTALSNLIPTRGTDGYNAVTSLILYKSDSELGLTVLNRISFAIVCLSTATALYSVLRLGEGYWICGFLLLSLARELESIRKRHFLRF